LVISKEKDRTSVLVQGAVNHPAERFLAALHPKPMQVYPRQVGYVFSRLVDKDLYSACTYGVLVLVWVGKG